VPVDVVGPLGLGEERVHLPLGTRAAGAARSLPDHVDLLARVAIEALLGEVARRLRLRPGRVVVGVEFARQRRAHPDDHDRPHDPAHNHATAAAVGDVGETD
jgi:hypothetical protein